MKSISSPNRWASGLPVVLLLLPLATGCGGRGQSTVSGKVAYQGKPLSSGIITMVPEAGAPAYTEIQSDGSYRMNNAPLGNVKIAVQPNAGQEVPESPGRPQNPKDYGKLQAAMSESQSQIPAKYTDPNNSGLTYTVMQGQQQHNIDLK